MWHYSSLDNGCSQDTQFLNPDANCPDGWEKQSSGEWTMNCKGVGKNGQIGTMLLTATTIGEKETLSKETIELFVEGKRVSHLDLIVTSQPVRPPTLNDFQLPKRCTRHALARQRLRKRALSKLRNK